MPRPFDVRVFLESSHVRKSTKTYQRADSIFLQGDACTTVMYIRDGTVRISTRSVAGKEVVVAELGAGEFFGEGCLAGQSRRMGSATAITATKIISFKKKEMLRLVHTQPALANRFISHLLSANIRIEQDLVNQLFNHEEKRLARTLLLLARYGGPERPEPILPVISNAKLATLSGTTPSRVKFFMTKFARLGFVKGGNNLTVDRSLLSVMLHE